MQPITDPSILAALEGAPVDDATAAELDRQEQLDRTRAAGRQAYEESSGFQKFGIGLARPFVELGKGIEDLAGRVGIGDGLEDEDRDAVERMEQVHGGAGTAGRIAGELAMFALPGGAASKVGTKAATLFPRTLARLAPAAADVGMAAGVEALKASTENTSRGERAFEGALGAGVGAGVGKVLKTAVRGFKPRPEAAAMMRDGVPLTPGMARGGVLQSLEEKLASIPGLAGPIRARHQEATEGWNRNMLQRAMPDGEVTAAGHEGFQQVTKAFKEDYDALWNQQLPFDLPRLESGWNGIAINAQRALAPESTRLVASKLRKMLDEDLLPATQNLTDISGPAISSVDDALRKEAVAAARRGAGDEAKVYNAARAKLRELLPPEVSAELVRLDGLYRQFATLRRAAGYKSSAQRGGVFTPSQLTGAVVAADKSAGKGATARGEAVLQQEAANAADVLGSGTRPLGTAEKLGLGAAAILNPGKALAAGVAGRAAYSRGGARYLTGQTGWQKSLEASLEKRKTLLDAIHELARSSTVGAAIQE